MALIRTQPLISLLFLAVSQLAAQSPESSYSFDDAQRFLKTHCLSCHQGKPAAGGLNVTQLAAKSSFHDYSQKWSRMAVRVRNGEMPPKGMPALTLDQREIFAAWVQNSL